jgi:glycosyltransferase involved in cell wall biosynthesis
MTARPGTNLVMLSTAGRGGMRSVVDAYARDGLFTRWNVHVLYPHVEGHLLRRIWAAALALAPFTVMLFRGQVGLLHSHVATKGSFWRKAAFAELARWFRVPVVLHLHGGEMEVFYDAQPSLGKRQVRRQLEKANRVIVLSPYWRDFVATVAPGAKIETVVNYVRLPSHSECVMPHRGLRVVFLGVICDRKGIYDLLSAFKLGHETIPEMQLLMGGHGEVDEATAAVQALKLTESVVILGWVAGVAKDALLSTADIFVLPSYYEAMPISLLEAMSFGVPVISTRVGGIPELVRDEVDGFLVEAGDVSALGERLNRLAADPELRRRMGDAGRQRVATEFSDVAVLPRLESIYTELLGGNAPRR